MSTTSLQINPESPPFSLQPVLIPANADGHDGSPGCHGVWFDVVLVVASVVFLGYLSIHAKKNLKKLYNRGSYILISYYALLWFATLLNLTWSSLQTWQCSPGKEVAWNLLSLFTTSGMLCLEISLLAFLLQEDYTSGLDALAHNFMVSGIIVGVDMLLKVIFGFCSKRHCFWVVVFLVLSLRPIWVLC